jgi:hypothetical protein
VIRAIAARAGQAAARKLIFSAPLTHSDWMHMLDAAKACGWSIIY